MKCLLQRFSAALALAGLFTTASMAQDAYPTRPIRIVVPFGAGGITDVVGRLIAQQISTELKQSVVVENKPGAGGNIAAQTVSIAEPDGYTLLLGTVGTQVVNRMVYPKIPFDPQKLVPISLVSNSPYVIAVSGLPGVETLSDLVAAAKKEPGKLNFGSAGYGSSPHLGLELLKLRTGIDITHVPFKSGGDAVTAALGKQVQMVFDAIPVVVPQGNDTFKPLVIASPERSRAAPALPTAQEQGFDGLTVGSWNCLVAPRGTPPERIATISDALNRVLMHPDVRDRLAELGIEPLPTGVPEYEAFVARETEKWSKVVEAGRIRLQ